MAQAVARIPPVGAGIRCRDAGRVGCVDRAVLRGARGWGGRSGVHCRSGPAQVGPLNSAAGGDPMVAARIALTQVTKRARWVVFSPRRMGLSIRDRQFAGAQRFCLYSGAPRGACRPCWEFRLGVRSFSSGSDLAFRASVGSFYTRDLRHSKGFPATDSRAENCARPHWEVGLQGLRYARREPAACAASRSRRARRRRPPRHPPRPTRPPCGPTV